MTIPAIPTTESPPPGGRGAAFLYVTLNCCVCVCVFVHVCVCLCMCVCVLTFKDGTCMCSNCHDFRETTVLLKEKNAHIVVRLRYSNLHYARTVVRAIITT